MATTRKEFVSLYLETKGVDKKGNALKGGALDEEQAKTQFTEYLLSNLSKLYAQIEVAKEFGFIDNELVETILKSAKADDNLIKDRKPYYIDKLTNEINHVLKTESNINGKDSKYI